MKKFIFAFTFLFVTSAYAHCPFEVSDASGDYCFDIEWVTGQKKVKGAFVDVAQMSPYLNKMSELPTNWIYSQALVKVWRHGDTTHQPVEIADFSLLPFMTMADGHHHGASSKWTYDATKGAYVLSGMSFQEMEGCWSLYSQMGDQDAQVVDSVTEFVNLTPTEIKSVEQFCSNSTPAPGDGGGHHHH